MKSTKRIARQFTGLFICMFILGSTGLNGQVIEKSIEELTRDSKTILYGKCTRIESSWDENQERIYTEITVLADGYLKGAQGSEIIITVPGGRVDNILYDVSDMPAFEQDEEIVAFLSEHSSGRNLVTGAIQGKLKIHKDANSGNRFVKRPVPEPATTKKAAKVFDESTQKTETISLTEFIAEIEGYLGQ